YSGAGAHTCSIGETPGNDHCDGSSQTRRAAEGTPAPDSFGALSHPGQAEMSTLPSFEESLIHAHTVVDDAKRKIVAVLDHDLQATSACMRARIPDRLVADSVDLFADDRVQLLGFSCPRDTRLQRVVRAALVEHGPKRFAEIVCLGH